MTLPTLRYQGNSKVGLETAIYFNTDVGLLTKYGSGQGLTNVTKCGGGNVIDDCPQGSFTATAILKKNESAVGSLPRHSPLYRAVEGEVTPTGNDDWVGIYCLPDPANDVLLCLDQGMSITPGNPWRAVPRKFNPVDHYVPQVPEHSVTVNDLFISNYAGLQRINGIPVTLIVKIYPQGVQIPQEIQYYLNVVVTVPTMNSGSDQNASIDISATGNVGGICIFSQPAS